MDKAKTVRENIVYLGASCVPCASNTGDIMETENWRKMKSNDNL